MPYRRKIIFLGRYYEYGHRYLSYNLLTIPSYLGVIIFSLQKLVKLRTTPVLLSLKNDDGLKKLKLAKTLHRKYRAQFIHIDHWVELMIFLLFI